VRRNGSASEQLFAGLANSLARFDSPAESFAGSATLDLNQGTDAN